MQEKIRTEFFLFMVSLYVLHLLGFGCFFSFKACLLIFFIYVGYSNFLLFILIFLFPGISSTT